MDMPTEEDYFGESAEYWQQERLPDAPAIIQQQVQLDSEHKQGTYDNPVDAIVIDAPRELT